MTTRTASRNIYAGPCTECQETVHPYAGTRQKVGTRWTVTHDRCPAVEEAEYQAERAAAETRHSVALAQLAEAGLTPVQLVELQFLQLAQRNSYAAGYLRIVEDATSLEQARARITAASQGMTMDYMSEFAQESAAVRLAVELAEARFPVRVCDTFRMPSLAGVKNPPPLHYIYCETCRIPFGEHQ